MIAYNCPIGRAACDGCNNLLTGDCLSKQSQSQQSSITHDDIVAHYDRKKEELMKLSKEELVELLIGKREHVGMTFG
jgi:hypothetical protein